MGPAIRLLGRQVVAGYGGRLNNRDGWQLVLWEGVDQSVDHPRGELPYPGLQKDVCRDLVKLVKKLISHNRVAIGNVRRDGPAS